LDGFPDACARLSWQAVFISSRGADLKCEEQLTPAAQEISYLQYHDSCILTQPDIFVLFILSLSGENHTSYTKRNVASLNGRSFQPTDIHLQLALIFLLLLLFLLLLHLTF
jgi:hypothetical protein